MPLNYKFKGNYDKLEKEVQDFLHQEFPIILMQLGIGILNETSWDEFTYRLKYIYKMRGRCNKKVFETVKEYALKLIPTETNATTETRLQWYKRIEVKSIKKYNSKWLKKLNK